LSESILWPYLKARPNEQRVWGLDLGATTLPATISSRTTPNAIVGLSRFVIVARLHLVTAVPVTSVTVELLVTVFDASP
jgi:hypothetical protein